MGFFVASLISLSAEFSIGAPGADMQAHVAESHRAHEAIVAAVLAGDAETAKRRMRSHLVAISNWIPKKA